METNNKEFENELNKSERPVAISVEHVSKVYKLFKKPVDRVIDAMHLAPWRKVPEHHALEDVNFKVYQGETVGIIGTNGSGKSTILKLLPVFYIRPREMWMLTVVFRHFLNWVRDLIGNIPVLRIFTLTVQ